MICLTSFTSLGIQDWLFCFEGMSYKTFWVVYYVYKTILQNLANRIHGYIAPLKASPSLYTVPSIYEH